MVKRHANGGGLVMDNAYVAPKAYLGKGCVARDNAQILENAVVDGMAVVEGNSIVSGNALVSGVCLIAGNTLITDYAVVISNRKFYDVVIRGYTTIDTYKTGRRLRPRNASASKLTLTRPG